MENVNNVAADVNAENKLAPAVQELVTAVREAATQATGESRLAVQALLDGKEDCFTAEITPEMAALILSEHNKLNRDLTTAGVNRINDFAEDMQSSKWMLTNQGIGFYTDKTLSDGQHRLFAVFKSGTTQHFAVLKGLPSESVHVIDRVTPRNLSQSLHFKGISDAGDIAAVAKVVCAYVSELELGFKPRVNDVKLMEWVERNLDMLKAAIHLGRISTENVTEPVMNARQAANLIGCMLLGGWTQEAVLPYVAAIQQGLAPYADSPTLVYSKMLQKAKYSDRRKDSMNNTQRIALGLKAARLFSEHQCVARLTWSPQKEGLVPVTPPEADVETEAA